MINLEMARDLLKRAMETQGEDFVYNPGGMYTCYYQPVPYSRTEAKRITGCLIGVALTLAGETRHIGRNGSVSSLRRIFPDMMSTHAVTYFQIAQSAQDAGLTWGVAYKRAEDSL